MKQIGRFKKLLSLVLTLLTVIGTMTIIPLTASAEAASASLIIAGVDGAGTEDNPYVLSTVAECLLLEENDDNLVSPVYVEFDANIDFEERMYSLDAGACVWHIDGKGHTLKGLTGPGLLRDNADGTVIQNLTIAASEGFRGIFIDMTGGTIAFENCKVASDVTVGSDMEPDVGSFVGIAYHDLTFVNCVNESKVTGNNYVGGFVGVTMAKITFTRCWNAGEINCVPTYDYPDIAAGGFVGCMMSSTIMFNKCVNVGTATAPFYAGGFVGATNGMNSSDDLVLKDCYDNGTVNRPLYTVAEDKAVTITNEKSVEQIRAGITLARPVAATNTSAWDGSTRALPALEDSTSPNSATNRYLITTAAELAYFSDATDSYYLKLTKHMDLGGYEWTPLSGVEVLDIDGDNYSILNLKNSNYSAGFIASHNAGSYTVSNLHFVGAKCVTSGSVAGVLMGYVTGNQHITITNVTVDVTSRVASNRSNGNRVGGFIGLVYPNNTSITIRNSINAALVVSDASVPNIDATQYGIGGFVGGMDNTADNALIIENSLQEGGVYIYPIQENRDPQAGSLVGYVSGNCAWKNVYVTTAPVNAYDVSFTDVYVGTQANNPDNKDAIEDILGGELHVHTYDHACDATCNGADCNHTRAVSHAYDNACDTSCNLCGTVRTVIGHKWNSGVITTRPTQTTTGEKLFTCTECGEIKTETIPMLEDTVRSGTWGNLWWSFNETTGELIISGQGEMEDLGIAPVAAWRAYKDSIQSVVIEDGITSIGKYAFSDCSSLTNVTIGNSVISIGEEAFWRCSSLTSISIPDSVTSIGEDAFSICFSLTSIEIPDSVTSIGDGAFSDCDSLTSIEIPDSVTSIGDGAFSNCDSLTNIEIPDSVTSIGDGAFSSCRSLTSINIPDSVTSIGDGAFSFCISLTSITVSGGNSVYHAAGNCLIETESKTLIAGCQSSVIPTDGSVTSIGDDAFYGCDSLTSINIPDSVTSIGDRAFFFCISLTSIEIPDSVESIGDGVFSLCRSLEKIIFCGTQAKWNAVNKEEGWNPHNIPVGFHDYKSTSMGATSHKTVCRICGDRKPVSDHSWDGGVITVDPTHTTEGEKFLTCADCGETKTETVPPTSAHNYGVWQRYDAEQHRRVCSCNDVQYADHTWDGGVVTVEPTHEAKGEKLFTCVDCGEAKTEEIDKLADYEHIYTEYRQINSKKHKKMCECGETVIEEHVFDEWEMLNHKNHKGFCKCGQSITEKHVFDEWESVDADTHKRVCVCGAEEIEEHVYDNDCDEACNECGVTREDAHVYGDACDTRCNECNAKRESPHVFDNACDAECNACGEKRDVDGHTYSDGKNCDLCGLMKNIEDAETTAPGESVPNETTETTAPGESVPNETTETTAAVTDTQPTQPVQIPIIPSWKGCGGALNSSYAVIALIALLGFALVAKKREEK